MTYFEVGCSWKEPNNKMMMQTVKKSLLIDAMTFTEAEASANRYFDEESCNEPKVLTEKVSPVSTVIEGDDEEPWYRVKTLQKFEEKKSKTVLAIQAKSVEAARMKLEEYMKGSVDDWELVTIDKTTIVGLVKHAQASESESDAN